MPSHTNPMPKLHASYASLGREFKSVFDDLVNGMNEQLVEAQRLRQEMAKADEVFVSASKSTQDQLNAIVTEERIQSAGERQALLAQIATLINTTADTQDHRLRQKLSQVSDKMDAAIPIFRAEHDAYGKGMDAWAKNSAELIDNVIKSRDKVKAKVCADYSVCDLIYTFRS
jgi:kinesin family member 11